MKVRVNLGKVQVEAEGDTLVAVYEELSSLEEIFGCKTACKYCKSSDHLRHIVRKVKKGTKTFKYYELHCFTPIGPQAKPCGGKFCFGVSNEEPKGGLFPQRKDKEGKYKPNDGWSKYDPKKDNEAEEE